MKPNKAKLRRDFVGQENTNEASTICVLAIQKILSDFQKSNKLVIKADGCKTKAFQDAIEESNIRRDVQNHLAQLDLPDGYKLSLHQMIVEYSCFSGFLSLRFSTALYQNETFLEYYNGNSHYTIAKTAERKVVEIVLAEPIKPKSKRITLDEIFQRVEEVEELRKKIESLERTLQSYAHQRR